MSIEATRTQRWLAAAGLAAAAALVPQARHAEALLETTVRIEGSEAQEVTRELAERFQSPLVHPLILVARGLPAVDSDEGKRVLRQVVESLVDETCVAEALSWLDVRDTIFIGKGGGTFVIVGLSAANDCPVEALPRLRDASRALQDRLRASYPAASLQWTGEIPLGIDLRRLGSDDARESEMRVLPVILAALVVSFGSVGAALLPVAGGVLAIAMTLGSVALLAHHFSMSVLILNLASMMGLGLGIDYALLMVTRFREAQALGSADSEVLRRAGRTLLLSAATVAIGFSALLTVPVSELRSIGAAGLLVAGMGALLSVGLVPVVLAALGSRIDIGSSRRLGALDRSRRAADRWHRWGMRVASHPWKTLALAGMPLALLAAQASRLEPGLRRGDLFPASVESAQALKGLQAMERGGVVESLRVILELPEAMAVDSDAGWAAISNLTRYLAADPRAVRVISLSTAMRERDASLLAQLPDTRRRSLVRIDGRATLVEVIPAASVDEGQRNEWVRELRRADAAAITETPYARIRVGGIPAINVDYADVISARLPSVMAIAVAATLVSLLVGFGSILVAVKAVALNLLSVGASFGALVLVFQEGYGGSLFGVAGGTGGVPAIVPILTFAIVFGLSMDYEVFLVARVLEARRSGCDERGAIAMGLATTGGLITRAAAIMVLVFGAFTLGSFLVVKMIGFTLAVAILADALLVRTLIGPALLALAGDWNWWPWGLR